MAQIPTLREGQGKLYDFTLNGVTVTRDTVNTVVALEFLVNASPDLLSLTIGEGLSEETKFKHLLVKHAGMTRKRIEERLGRISRRVSVTVDAIIITNRKGQRFEFNRKQYLDIAKQAVKLKLPGINCVDIPTALAFLEEVLATALKDTEGSQDDRMALKADTSAAINHFREMLK
uniref:Uncharacterized protein n=1 Tax=Tilapia lake virus TaxID=1549864 RepID=A0A7G4P279_9VIRU|nr:hypothetical protein [Tilapia lake virus]